MNAKAKKCPVCQWKIKEAGIKVKAGKREVVVCCDDCADKVRANPERYTQTDR